MTSLKSQLLNLSKTKTVPAVVTDVLGTLCTVRLSQRGLVLKNLRYIGVAPQVLDIVEVDYGSPIPVVRTGYKTEAPVSSGTPISSSSSTRTTTSTPSQNVPPPETKVSHHNDLPGLEGGAPATETETAEYYHLSEAQHTREDEFPDAWDALYPRYSLQERPPTVDDDLAAGYPSPTIWVDVLLGLSYVNTDDAEGAAVWIGLGGGESGGGGGGGSVSFIIEGELAVSDNAAPSILITADSTIEEWMWYLENPGSSGQNVVDVILKRIGQADVSIFDDGIYNPHPTIGTDAYAINPIKLTPVITDFLAGDVLQIDVEEVGDGASQLIFASVGALGGGASSITYSGLPVQVVTMQTREQGVYTNVTEGDGTEMTLLNITITPKKAGNKILLQWTINFETHWDALFLVSRNGVLLPNSTDESNHKYAGIAVPNYDEDADSTPQQLVVTIVDEDCLDIETVYSVLCRSSNTYSQTFLNRTVNAANSNAYEDMMSAGYAMEFGDLIVSAVGGSGGGGGETFPAEMREYVYVRDEKPINTHGGTFSAGAWRTRDLNTIVSDDGSNCTLANNQITLLPGTYEFNISAPSIRTACHVVRLYDITHGEIVEGGEGTAEFSIKLGGDGIQTTSKANGRFTITEDTTFEIQHQCTSSEATIGFGIATNLQTEVYAQAEFWKIEEGTGSISVTEEDVAIIIHEEGGGVDGGTPTANGWHTRHLNVVDKNEGNHISLANDVITIEAGTYEVEASASFYCTLATAIRLYNNTAGTTIARSLSSYLHTSGVSGLPVVRTKFTIYEETEIELQYSVQNAQVTYGLGVSAQQRTPNFVENDIYAQVYLKKVA